MLFKIRVHPTLWFVIGIAILTAHFVEVMMLLLIVFIHEMGHATCAQHFKWRIKSIHLLPFGGAVETEEYGNKSLKEDLAVVLAGPLQHVWLIGAAFLLYSLSFISYELYQPFLYMNLMLLVFNLSQFGHWTEGGFYSLVYLFTAPFLKHRNIRSIFLPHSHSWLF